MQKKEGAKKHIMVLMSVSFCKGMTGDNRFVALDKDMRNTNNIPRPRSKKTVSISDMQPPVVKNTYILFSGIRIP
jgi:hypothetical protein